MRNSASNVRVPRIKLAALAVMSCFASASALANPTGVISSSGVVSMTTPMPNVLEITNNPGAIIHWQGFSISAGELTRFIQNSASSAVLNRVMGTDQSDILGTLQSNGRVFLINPNGIAIGAGAMLDLPGFVASSLDMTDADFATGRMRFQEVPGTTAGAVTNNANISMSAGGQVYLIGGTVMNGADGIITSPNGEVVLAAGHSVELMSAAVPGVSVEISATDNSAVNLGQVFVNSGRAGIFGGVVNQGGVVSANTVVAGADGSVRLVATDTAHIAAGSTTLALGGTFEVDTGHLRVEGDVHSGAQRIRASGGVVVENPVGGFAQLGASGGQAIDAGYVEITGNAGGSASIFNFGGEQRITTTATNAAGEGLAVRAFDDGFAVIDAPSGPQTIAVRNADSAVIDAGSGFARITAGPGGPQTITLGGSGANALVLGSPDAAFQSLIGANDQAIVAGGAGEQGSVTVHGTANGTGGTALILTFPGAGGNQTVSTSGALNIFGGSAPGNSATGIFANQAGGHQTISADSVLIQGGDVGFGNSAIIGANSGSQTIHAGAGGITLRGGAAGGNNFVQINQASSDPVATQTITSAGPVLLEGGSGNFNFALVRAFGGHQALTFGDTTLLAGEAGIDNFSVIQGREQDVTVHGDLEITARGSAGSPTIGGGARIGGLGGGTPTPTQLRLDVDGDVTMTGGSLAGTGVLLGNTNNFVGNTDIRVNAGGDVTLDGGSVPDTYSLIGSRAGNLAGGGIAVRAIGSIALNSTAPAQVSIFRTTDSVTLTARQITQGSDAFIEAGSLNVLTQQGASLTGDNAVEMLSLSNQFFGDVAFNNASDLLTVTQALNVPGALSLQQDGDMRVSGNVFSGPQNIDVSGGLRVENAPFSFAQIGADGGQTINAGYVEVIGNAGGSANIFNFGGEQRVTTSSSNAAGEGLAVRAFEGGFAVIDSPGGAQTIDVRNADRAVIDSVSGFASVNSFGGPQSISLTGAGANALVLGSPGARFQSLIIANDQSVLAGGADEHGSITIHGTADGAFGTALILTPPTPGGSQTVSTSGALNIFGGSAPGNGATGIFANGDGGQTIRADSIVLQAGLVGNGNSAMIGANNGSQNVEVGAGGIALRGGEVGSNNFVQIAQQSPDPAFAQSIHSAGPVHLQGGDSGFFNFAMIRSFGGSQRIEAGSTSLLGGAGGTNNFAAILSPHQHLTVHGDLDLTARGSGGTPGVGGGTRIGGLGGALASATDLVLEVDGNITLAGGSVAAAGTSIGGNAESSQPVDMSLQAGGDIALNPGAAADSRLGSSSANVANGDIQVQAGGVIALNGADVANAGAIRTLDGVALRANRITQGAGAQIQAGTLAVHTAQGGALVGANAVSNLSAINTSSGNVAFNNTSALLTVTGIDQVKHGALALNQAGNLRIHGDVTSGAQNVSATGDMTITPGVGPNVTVHAHGAQTFNVGGSFSLLGGTSWNGYARTLAKGPVNMTTGGDLNVRGGSGLLAYALLYGGDDIRLTVGDELHVDGGSGLLAVARVQTDLWDRIFLDFPNRASGGYFVNGREGVSHRGLDGFFTGFVPAQRGRGLIVSYGE